MPSRLHGAHSSHHPVDRHVFSHTPPTFPIPHLPSTLHSILTLQAAIRRDLQLACPSSHSGPPSENSLASLHHNLAAAHIPYDGDTPSTDFVHAILHTGFIDDLLQILHVATHHPAPRRLLRFSLPRLLTLLHSYVLASDLLAARVADNQRAIPLLLAPMHTRLAIDISIPLVEEIMHASPRYAHFELTPLHSFPQVIKELSPFQLGAICRVLALFVDDRDNTYLCSNDSSSTPTTSPTAPPNADWRRIDKPHELLKARRSYLDPRGKLARERNHAALLSIPNLLDNLVKIISIPPPSHGDILVIDEALRSGIHSTNNPNRFNNNNNHNDHPQNEPDDIPNIQNNNNNNIQNDNPNNHLAPDAAHGSDEDEHTLLSRIQRRVLVMVYRRLIGSHSNETLLVQADSWPMLENCVREAELLWADTGFIGHATRPSVGDESLSRNADLHHQQSDHRDDDVALAEALAAHGYDNLGPGPDAGEEELVAAVAEFEDAIHFAAEAAEAATEAMNLAAVAEAAVADAGQVLAENGVDVEDLDIGQVDSEGAVGNSDRASLEEGNGVNVDVDVDLNVNADAGGDADADGNVGDADAMMEVEVVGDPMGEVPADDGGIEDAELHGAGNEGNEVEIVEIAGAGGGDGNIDPNDGDNVGDGDGMAKVLQDHLPWVMSSVMLTHQVEALFVLYTLLNGKRRAEIRQRLMDMGIFAVVNRLFDSLDWRDARNETRTEDMLKVHMLRMVHYLCDGIDDNTLGDSTDRRKHLFTEGELEVIAAIEDGTWSEKYVVEPVGSGVKKAALRLVAERDEDWSDAVRIGTKGVKPALHFCVIHGECMICAGALAYARNEGRPAERTGKEGTANINRERGVIMKIVEILMGTLAGDEVNIGRRYLLSGCVETFQRSASMAEKTFVGRQGLVEHLVEQVCVSEQLTSHKNQFRQTSFDLLGHLVKWNRELFGVMNELLTGNHKVLTRLLKTVSERLIDSNVFVRSIALSLERFRAEDDMGLSEERYPFEQCVLWEFVEQWKVAIVYDLMRSVHVEDVNYENISSVNTTLIMFVIYGGETEEELDMLLSLVVEHLIGCVEADDNLERKEGEGAEWGEEDGKCDVVRAVNVLDNFASVVRFWMGYYMHQASDVTPLEVSTDIGFDRFVHSARLLLKRLPVMDAKVKACVSGDGRARTVGAMRSALGGAMRGDRSGGDGDDDGYDGRVVTGGGGGGGASASGGANGGARTFGVVGGGANGKNDGGGDELEVKGVGERLGTNAVSPGKAAWVNVCHAA